MTLLEFLRGIPNFQEYSRKSKILLLAYFLRQHRGLIEFAARDILACCRGVMKPPSGLPQQLKLLSKGKNSALIAGSKTGSYSLNLVGLNEVEGYLSSTAQSAHSVDVFLAQALPYLKRVLARVTEENQRKFMAEAVSCLGADARRAAIIMTWAGAIDHLYSYILRHKLADFNKALGRRADKYSHVKIVAKDDFCDIKESVFIEVARSANIISNDVRKILDEKLGIRNTCAHPSGVEVHGTKVVNFVEELVDNVIVKYTL
jgi:hypothetical protein